jgi:hypothetical protein
MSFSLVGSSEKPRVLGDRVGYDAERSLHCVRLQGVLFRTLQISSKASEKQSHSGRDDILFLAMLKVGSVMRR